MVELRAAALKPNFLNTIRFDAVRPPGLSVIHCSTWALASRALYFRWRTLPLMSPVTGPIASEMVPPTRFAPVRTSRQLRRRAGLPSS
jgi:hypothetical protein